MHTGVLPSGFARALSAYFLKGSSLSGMASKARGRGWDTLHQGNATPMSLQHQAVTAWCLCLLPEASIILLKEPSGSCSLLCLVCVCSNRGHCGCSVLGRPRPPLCLKRIWKVGIRMNSTASEQILHPAMRSTRPVPCT